MLVKFILPQISPKNKKTLNDDNKDSNKNSNGKTTITIIKKLNSSTAELHKNNNKAIKCLQLDAVDNSSINNFKFQPSPPKLMQPPITSINIKYDSCKEKNKITTGPSEYERAGLNKKFISSYSGLSVIHTSNQHPVPNFETEKKMTLNVLKQNKLILSYPIKFNVNLDNLFNHLHVISLNGNCFICNLHAGNLVEHLWQIHSFEPKMAIAECQCVCCGIKCFTRNNLIIHQFNVHQSIALSSTNRLYAVLNKANTNNIFDEVAAPADKPSLFGLSPISKVNPGLIKSPISSPPLLTAAKLNTIQLSPLKPQMPVLSAPFVSIEPKEKKSKQSNKSKLPLLIDLTINDIDDKLMSEKTKNNMKRIKSKHIKFKSAKSIADSLADVAKQVVTEAKPMQQCQLCAFKYEINTEFRQHFELVHTKSCTIKLERLEPLNLNNIKKMSNKLTVKRIKKPFKEEASDRRRSDRFKK